MRNGHILPLSLNQTHMQWLRAEAIKLGCPMTTVLRLLIAERCSRELPAPSPRLGSAPKLRPLNPGEARLGSERREYEAAKRRYRRAQHLSVLAQLCQ